MCSSDLGGGAEMKAVADYAQGALGRTVRIARPRGLVALPEAHAGPAFATLVGLALYGHMKPLEIGGPGSAGPRKGAGDGKGGWWQRLTHALKKNY